MLYNTSEVIIMFNLKLMVIEQKESTTDDILYYYTVNTPSTDPSKAGILSIKTDVFLHIGKGIKDYTLKAMELFMDKKISIIRESENPLKFTDCCDVLALKAAGEILNHYCKNNEIPKSMFIINDKIVKAMLQYEEFSQILINNSIMTKEEIEEYCNETTLK